MAKNFCAGKLNTDCSPKWNGQLRLYQRTDKYHPLELETEPEITQLEI